MPHVPPTGYSRSSHKFRRRATHDYDAAFYGPNAGAASDAEQWTYDQVLPPGSIRPGMSVTDLINGPATVTINDDGITIEDGALTLMDEFGSTVLVSSGFQGSWADFMGTGLYNGFFRAGVAGTIVDGRSAQLPYFTISRAGSGVVMSRNADTTMPGGYNLEVNFGAVTTDIGVVVSDFISVLGGHSYRAFAIGKGAGGSGTAGWYVRLYVNWYDESGVLISSAIPGDSGEGGSAGKTFGPNASLFQQRSGDSIILAPIDASFASVEVQMWEEGVHHANSYVRLGAVCLLPVPFGNDTLESFTFGNVDANGDVTANSGNVNSDGWVSAGTGYQDGSTAFPGSPTTNRRFFRTDLDMWFQWNGTYWLSDLQRLRLDGGGGYTISATLADFIGAVPYLAGGSDIWLEKLHTTFFVNAGTALSGSHKWVCDFNKRDSGGASTTLATVTIDSGASSTFRVDTQTIDALLGTTYFVFANNWVKTGTPGNLTYFHELTYRLRVT